MTPSRHLPAGPPARLRDISPNNQANPWSEASAPDVGPRSPGEIGIDLQRLEVEGGGDSSQNHSHPAELTWRRYRDEELPGMAVYAGFSEEHEAVGLFLMSLDGKSPITARMLAKVTIDGMRRHWRDQVAMIDDCWVLIYEQARKDGTARESIAAAKERHADRAKQLRKGKRPGRAGHPDAFYAEVALRYAVLAASTKSPVKALAAELKRSLETTRNLVYDARRKGFLTKASRGRAGGSPTPKALDTIGGS